MLSAKLAKWQHVFRISTTGASANLSRWAQVAIAKLSLSNSFFLSMYSVCPLNGNLSK